MLKKILSFAALATVMVVYFVACKKSSADVNKQPLQQVSGEKQLLKVNFTNYSFESQQALQVVGDRLVPTGVANAISPAIELTKFATAAPFVNVYGVITGEGLEDENILVQFTGSADGKKWEDYITVKPSADAEATPSRMVFGNVELDKATKFVKFKISFLNQNASLKNADLYFYNPQVTPKEEQAKIDAEAARVRNEMAAMNGEGTTIDAPTNPALCAKPGFTSRSTWRARAARSNPVYTTVNFLCIHHEAGSNTSSDWAARVRAVQNLHMDVNGWSDIGYNYLVDPNGVSYDGRGGGENVIGAHLCGKNSNTMGVCMLGTFTSVRPTNNAEYTLKRILAWKTVQRGLNPIGTGFHVDRTIHVISGHRASCATDCPGNALFNDLDRLRNDVNTNFVSKCR